MNREGFINSIKNLGLNPSAKQLEQLDLYAEYLLEYNKHTNLTAIRDLEGVYLKHFYDSLTLTKSIDLTSINSMVDIGTGAGFPGMVIKIMFPHINMTLIDSNNKKITFLKSLIQKLDLDKIEAINIRSEEFALNNLDSKDLVTARAVSALNILTEIALPIVKVGGYFIPMKATIDEELKESNLIIKKLGGEVKDIINFTLPIENSTRNIIKIKKVFKTPSGYPRSYDKIKKSLKKSVK